MEGKLKKLTIQGPTQLLPALEHQWKQAEYYLKNAKTATAITYWMGRADQAKRALQRCRDLSRKNSRTAQK